MANEQSGNFRWTTKELSHTYTCIHSPPNSSPIQAATYQSVEFLVLYSRALLVIHVNYSSVALAFPIIHSSPLTRDLHLFLRLRVTAEDLSFQPEGLPAQEGRVAENSRSSHQLGMPQSRFHFQRAVSLNTGFLLNGFFPSTFQRH